MSYNGWINYETWAANIWLEGAWDWEIENFIRRAKASDMSTRDDVIAELEFWLDRKLHELEDDLASEMTNGLAVDLLVHAFDRIDTRELAEAFIGVVE